MKLLSWSFRGAERDAEYLALSAFKPAGRELRPNPRYVSARQTELCVCCRRDTGVPVSMPIEFRSNYVAGNGQYCPSCGFLAAGDD